MKDIIKAIFILIACMIIIILATIYIQSTVYAPIQINKSYEGIYFDFDNVEVSKPVNIIISGNISKDSWLQPESFVGTIMINSSRFEIIQPLRFGRMENTLHLSLNDSEKGEVWDFNADYQLKHFEKEAFWDIYVDRTFSNITFVPMIPDEGGNGGSSSTERISAPCDNNTDAMTITRMLMSGELNKQ